MLAAGEDRKFEVYGGLDHTAGWSGWRTDAGKHGAAFARFLNPLAAAFPPNGQLEVVLDTHGYHRGHAVRRPWVAHHDRIRPFWLLPCSPALNLSERVWHRLKNKLSNHRWWTALPTFERATGILLDRTNARSYRPEGTIS